MVEENPDHHEEASSQSRGFDEAKQTLEEINRVISQFEPSLREKARDILLSKAFGIPLKAETFVGRDVASSSEGRNGKFGLKTLLDRWTPDTQSERALLTVYYLQQVLGYPAVTGKQIQRNLKKCGLSLTNVTGAGQHNVQIRPPRLRTVRGIGKKQHYYVLTPDGIKLVENKLDGLE